MGWLAAAMLASAAISAGSAMYQQRQNEKFAGVSNEDTWKYYQKQKALDYQYDSGKYFDLDKAYSEYDYELQKRYTENSALWQMEGLRKAGLNPILAATNNNFGTVSGGVQQAQRNSGSMSRAEKANSVDIGSGINSAVNTAASVASRYFANQQTQANTSLLDEQLKTEQTQQELNKASSARQLADAEKSVLEAQKMKPLADISNNFSNLLHDASESLEDKIKQGVNSFQNSAESVRRDPIDTSINVDNAKSFLRDNPPPQSFSKEQIKRYENEVYREFHAPMPNSHGYHVRFR